MSNPNLQRPGKVQISVGWIGAGSTAAYLALAAWSYSAALGGNMIFAAILLAVAYLICAFALIGSEEYGAVRNRSMFRLNVAVCSVLGFLTLLIFFVDIRDMPPPAGSNLQSDVEIKGILVGNNSSPGEPIVMNYYFSNVGQIASSEPLVTSGWQTSDHEPNSAELETLYNKVLDRVKEEPFTAKTGNEMRPGDVHFLTAWGMNIVNFYSNVIQGKTWLTFLVYFRYVDNNTKPGEYRVSEFCGSFIYDFVKWKNCEGHNYSYTVHP